MRNYYIRHALFDIFMNLITGGFWRIYVIIRYLRTH